jgi:hypothetical protein
LAPQELLWIDRGTRLVIADFTVYNANINLFCIVKYVFFFSCLHGPLQVPRNGYLGL